MLLPTLTAPATAGRWYSDDEDLALADQLAQLPAELRDRVLKAGTAEEDDEGAPPLDPEDLLYDFRFWGRPSQLYAYDSDAWITALISGRGAGKTRTLSEIAHRLARKYPGSRGALVARTSSDVRGTMIKGDSGILSTCPPSEQPKYIQNNREVTWPNGTVAQTFTAAVPDLIRGPQFNWAVADEIASWPTRPPAGAVANAWDNLKLATRLGDHPQIFVATTPRRVPSVIELLNGVHAEPDKYRVVRGTTAANRHLADVYHRAIVSMYQGTTLARQELGGELLGDVEGALLRSDQISRTALTDGFDPMAYPTRIIGVDPSVSDKPRDECGIVVVVATNNRNPYARRAFVVADESLHGSPGTWAKRVAQLARHYQAFVVAEDNQGGEMVRIVLRSQDPDIPVALARSEASKAVRAEPVVLAYEQKRVYHTDFFGEYESQLTSWVPDESTYSPDRLDAGVIALSAALINPPSGMGGRIRLASANTVSRHIPGVKTHQRSILSDRRTTSPAASGDAFKPRSRLRFHRPGGLSPSRRRRRDEAKVSQVSSPPDTDAQE